ncbi:MAG: 16S rRNA (cytosine(967)-C(5))-methyltransferase RsmB [Deltaproteobacteria bacterium]|nr:16S rRNA (cytosine(967)-C(5))-methyltransferase RsmB [Deltaproteobacteria bacterium]
MQAGRVLRNYLSVTPHHENPRELAVGIVYRVERRNAYADVLLSARLDEAALPPVDGALLTRLVYGTLRWRGRIDWVLARVLRDPLDKLDPLVRNLLRVGCFELLFLDRVPSYATVNELVEMAKRRAGPGKARLVNAVLRRVAGREREAWRPAPDTADPAELAALVSHPLWLVDLWRERFGAAEIRRLMEANNEDAPLVLRANRLRVSRDDLVRRLRSHGVEARAGTWSPLAVRLRGASSPVRLAEFREGLCQVQGEASQMIGFLAAPEPGMRVLDVCAAPGGKTTHIAELMEGRGEVVACDVSERGLEKLADNARRLGLDCIRTQVCDAVRGLPGEPGSFDRVLVDAPCSGLGTLRAHPEIRWRREPRDLHRLAALQADILQQAATRVAPGGLLVYATCTLSRPENEEVVEGFLERHREFAVEEAAEHLPSSARSMAAEPYFLALPHRHDTEGFFAARLRRPAAALVYLPESMC